MQTDTPTIDRHRTALPRPVRLALEHGLLPSGATAFDYGCGHGGDVPGSRSPALPWAAGIAKGKIHTRPIRLTALRDELEALLGVKVVLSVLKRGGAFNQPPPGMCGRDGCACTASDSDRRH